MIWLLYYLLACWGIAALMAVPIWRTIGTDSPSESQEIYPLFTIPITVLTGPLWLPYVLWCTAVGVRDLVPELWQLWQAYRYRKTYHEYTLRKVNFFQLPQVVRDGWDATVPQFFRLGFSLLGDYQLRDQPYQLYDRFYWHQSGAIDCAACALALAGDVELDPTLTSRLEDGTNIITTTAQLPPKRKRPNPLRDKLHLICLPGATAEELFSRHRQEVVAMARDHRWQVLAFDPQQLEELVIHDQRVFCGWLHRSGQVSAPPGPVLPTPRATLTPDEFLDATAGCKIDGT